MAKRGEIRVKPYQCVDQTTFIVSWKVTSPWMDQGEPTYLSGLKGRGGLVSEGKPPSEISLKNEGGHKKMGGGKRKKTSQGCRGALKDPECRRS